MIEKTGVNPKLDKLLEIEAKYPVEQWKINEVHIWPVLRARLYIEMAAEDLDARYDSSVAGEKKTSHRSVGSPVVASKWKELWHFILFILRPLKKSRAIFVSPASFNDNFRGKWYNKFFDPIRMGSPDYKQSYIIEIGKAPSGQLENTLFIGDYSSVLSFFNRFNRRKLLITHLEGYDSFCREVAEFTQVIKRFPERALVEAYYTIKKHESLFKVIIRKTRAKEAYSLCYYIDSYIVMGMNLAAYKLNIESIDIQHGGQGPVHLAYCKFQRLPDSGRYEIMPSSFWCWDKFSKHEIDKWCMQAHSRHKAFVGGQPWLSFIRKELQSVSQAEPVVLYTLQPFGELISPKMLRAIQLIDPSVKWIIRLHPRTQSRRGELEQAIHEYDIGDRIHAATWEKISLPESIAISRVHVSRTSGSIIEAAFMDVPNIILDIAGATLYQDWIREGKAHDATAMEEPQLAELVEQLAGLRH